jgi:hypothetical protein
VVEDNLCGLYSGKRPRYILSEREVFERDRAPGSEMARYREHFDRIFGGEYRLVWQDPRMLIWERR